ncbi:thioredoxin [Candidatus Peregrinibacteria bacterium CG_4_10_14_0_2_um_filter_38_24]|nr:MAG: thioredoxin [Candidatus Peregrinibacteria bacterium CG_4_10_14_0_2_um_filter_38_24]
MAEMHFTKDNFEEEVVKSDKPVLVDFFAQWCGPCKMMGPVIEELAKEYEGTWKIGKCDIDESPELAEQFGVQSIPTLLFFKDGKVVDKAIGFQGKEALRERLG